MSKESGRHFIIVAASVLGVLVVTIAGLARFPTAVAQLEAAEDDSARPEFPVAVLVMPAVLSAILIVFEVIRKRTGLLVR